MLAELRGAATGNLYVSIQETNSVSIVCNILSTILQYCSELSLIAVILVPFLLIQNISMGYVKHKTSKFCLFVLLLPAPPPGLNLHGNSSMLRTGAP